MSRTKGLGQPDAIRVAQAERDLETVLALYDRILAKQRYIAGNQLTLADLFHLPNGAALKSGKWKAVFENYPSVDKWFSRLQKSETWLRAAGETKTIA